MYDLKDGLINAKRYSLEVRAEDLTKKINEFYSQFCDEEGYSPLTIMIDEKHPFEHYSNGFPKMQYQIYTQNPNFKLHFDLDYNLRGFNKDTIFEEAKNEISRHFSES